MGLFNAITTLEAATATTSSESVSRLDTKAGEFSDITMSS